MKKIENFGTEMFRPRWFVEKVVDAISYPVIEHLLSGRKSIQVGYLRKLEACTRGNFITYLPTRATRPGHAFLWGRGD